MGDKCHGYLFSNEPIFSKDRFRFFISLESNEKKNQLQIPKNSEIFLFKFEYEENSKYLVVEDSEKNDIYSCPLSSFTSHFICYISKNGKPKIQPKNKKKFNWLNVKVREPEFIKDILDFALLPHKFNNFFQISQSISINNSVEELQHIIFQFRPNGFFLSPKKYFDFTIDFILFYNGNDREVLDSPLFNNFVDIVINELSEMEKYIELSAISFCTKNRKIIPPLEVSHLIKSNADQFTQLCETVIIYYGNLFLLWAFNINYNLDLFFSLFKKWKQPDNFKFKVEDIFDIVEQKLQSNDFSNYALLKFLEFVNLYLQGEQLKDVEIVISDPHSKFTKFVKKQIKIVILHQNDEIQNKEQAVPRIDQKDYICENDNDNKNDNDNTNENANNSDQTYVNRINEFRGLWFNSIPDSFLYQRSANDKTVYSPPFTFRLYESHQIGLGARRFLSTRPNHDIICRVGNPSASQKPKFKSSRPPGTHQSFKPG